MNKSSINWKAIAIAAAGVIAVILLAVFCVQGAQNTAIHGRAGEYCIFGY